MNEHGEIKLGKFIEVINGYAFKSSGFLDHKEEGHLPVLKIKNVASGTVKLNDIQYHEVNENLSKYKVNRNDILIALTGNHPQAITQVVGEVAIYKFDEQSLLNQRVAKIVPKKTIDRHYLYYLLKEDSMHDYLASQSSGSGNQANISKKDIENISIKLPPLPEQKAIASVLSSLDDKIDLLHRQNQTLEAIAEALFKEWFLVNAKEEWEEKPLDEIANYLNGLACQKFPPKNEVNKLPVLKIKDLQSGISESSDWVSSDVPKTYLVQNGDIIFSWSASLLVKIWDGEDCILNQHLFKVTSEDYPKWFYYLWTKHYLDEFIAVAKSHATTMGHIKRSDLKQAMAKVPTAKEITEMDKHFTPLLDKIMSNNKQISTLTKLRDALLPKLMSGEVRVKM